MSQSVPPPPQPMPGPANDPCASAATATVSSNPPEPFTASQLDAIERTTQEVGRYLFEHLDAGWMQVFDRRWWDERILSWAMHEPAVQAQLFRFVDVLPMLVDRTDITRHLQEYLAEVEPRLPSAVRLGLLRTAPNSLIGRSVARAARQNALAQARRFIAGTTVEEVLAAAMRGRKLKRAFTIDLLGEAVTSQAEADAYLAAYVRLLEQISPAVNAWAEVPQLDVDTIHQRGQLALPRVNVSLKLSALDSQFDPLDAEGTYRRVAGRLRVLLRAARQQHAFVNIDMESYATKDLTLMIFQRLFEEDEFRTTADVGIVIQAYLRDSGDDLARLADWARRRGTPIWVRLVKGAYWDYEQAHALASGWPVPVFQRKADTDAQFERLTRYLFSQHATLRPAIASHNLRSLAHALAVAQHLGLPKTSFELQMLYGMADAEQHALVALGHRLRIYMPYGELIPGMAYLVRRLLENSSNDSFLRATFTEHTSPEQLLMNPNQPAAPPGANPLAPQVLSPPQLLDFENEPLTDFVHRDKQRAMQSALEQVPEQFGRFWPLVIAGEEIATIDRLTSLNPSHRAQVLGTAASADRGHVDRAVQAARAAQPEWERLGAMGRGNYLRAVASAMRARRFELAAWIVYEAGKGWRDADADVAEAIDFCRYYAAGALALEEPAGRQVPGEENRYGYFARGVAAVIAPWNFPLAILTGMTTAALATGNTVIMKPAEQTPLVAAQLMQLFRDAGLPPGVVNYLPGRGDLTGAALVEHPDVDLIAFTGSRDVGLTINARAADVSCAATRGVKKVITEMGGKNAIVIDTDADLDEAVQGVVRSALGYQGQKCSACSRVILVGGVYEPFAGRLLDAIRSLKVGPADDPSSHLGPLIDDAARQNVERYIALARQEGRELLRTELGTMAQEGFYVGPHVFGDVSPEARVAQEEIFGPVLCLLRATDFAHALQLVNQTNYALTAGVYSRSPAHLRRAQQEIRVGNLYLNRPITGALVGRQPFGGFRLSGIGSQAGGPDYLAQFVVPRTITENTLRRGFVPPTQPPATPSDRATYSSLRQE